MTGHRTVTAAGSSVHLLEGGEGPAVLLLHGSGPGTTGAGAWRRTVETHSASFHLVAPDQPGFGRSSLPAGSRGGLEQWTATAADLMEVLGLDSYAVVGHSMGGAVALALAAAHPSRVTRVVAVSTMGAPGAPLSPALDALWAAPPGRAGAQDMLGHLFHDQSLVTEGAVTARALAMKEGAAGFSPLFPPPRERWVEDLTLSPGTMAGVRAPVLLVHGARDRVTPLHAATDPLLAHLADVRLHVFGGCGHSPMVERPDEFQFLLGDFLRLELLF